MSKSSLEEKLKNMDYKEEYIGENVKYTKKSFKWKFDYEYKTYKVELQDSKLSGKKRVLLDDKLIKEVEE